MGKDIQNRAHPQFHSCLGTLSSSWVLQTFLSLAVKPSSGTPKWATASISNTNTKIINKMSLQHLQRQPVLCDRRKLPEFGIFLTLKRVPQKDSIPAKQEPTGESKNCCCEQRGIKKIDFFPAKETFEPPPPFFNLNKILKNQASRCQFFFV